MARTTPAEIARATMELIKAGKKPAEVEKTISERFAAEGTSPKAAEWVRKVLGKEGPVFLDLLKKLSAAKGGEDGPKTIYFYARWDAEVETETEAKVEAEAEAAAAEEVT